jgi:hypothetical protein
MKTLAKIKFGSKLYGTDIETSDLDFRAVYLPNLSDCILGKVKDAWEDKGEEDTSFFSLQKICGLAMEGQSVAIELLAAPSSSIAVTSPTWEELRNNRKRFYTKNMYSFLGFSKSMAGRYSSRIDRLRETEEVLAILQAFPRDSRLGEFWDALPQTLNLKRGANERNKGEDKRVYVVCGREIQATVLVSHAYSVVKGVYDSYGERVRRAKDGVIEYKSLAHAFRAALQCKEIVETGDLQFPLKDANWLRDLRLGKIDFFKNELDLRLDELIAEVQAKIDASSLPEKADAEWVNDFILRVYDKVIRETYIKSIFLC